MGLKNKLFVLVPIMAGIATALFLLYNSFSQLSKLDLNDPFEVDFEEE